MKRTRPRKKQTAAAVTPGQPPPQAAAPPAALITAPPGQAPAGAAPADDLPHCTFPIVAVAGGAGSLNAFAQLLAHLSADPGLAFLYCTTESSNGTPRRLLENASVLPVVTVSEAADLQPNHIYVPIRGRALIVQEGGTRVKAQAVTKNSHGRIDMMFRCLAMEAREYGCAIVLCGDGMDGIEGLLEVKEHGGLTLAQDPASAGGDKGLITRAVASGAVESVLPMRRMAEELIQAAARLRVATELAGGPASEREEFLYSKIFSLLRALTGVDFTFYKPNTVKRRIARRMVLNKITAVEAYVRLLQQQPSELDHLFRDILIHVTAFFRDPGMFEALKRRIFPRILKNNPPEAPIRIWVPGCSSGEEAYSVAITLVEYLGAASHPAPIQVFATDISDVALNKARAGHYPESISTQMPPERLRRFFQKTERGFQISKSIRDLCVFARQNLFEDPPFSKLDLISCRNVLIYLGAVLQKKVIPIFHYALKPNGYLVLGGSETIGVFSDLFDLVDKRQKIYLKRPNTPRTEVEFTPRLHVRETTLAAPGPAPADPRRAILADVSKQVDRLLLSQFAPSGVVVNSHYEVLQFRGQTGVYLEHASGDASLNLLKMVREGLVMELRTLLSRALKMELSVRKEGISFRDGKQQRRVNIDVIPFHPSPSSKDRFLLVLFSEPSLQESSKAEKDGRAKRSTATTERETLRLREELLTTKGSLQAIIEEQEATNEELKSANEEIQSSNEELQSTNEELETAKEELQSTNEELTTLNEELQNRNCELSLANDDMTNLLSCVNLPIIMLGSDLSIRRFTPLAERLFKLIPSDVGRQISDINPRLKISDLDRRVSEVIETLKSHDLEVQDSDDRWYSLRIRPYRTTDHKIDGAVIVLVDINELKRGLEELLEIVRQPLLLLSGDFRVQRANAAFYRFFQLERAAVEGQPVYELDDKGWNVPGLRALLEGILPEQRRVQDFRIQHDFARIGKRSLRFDARVLRQESKGTQLVILAIEELAPEHAQD